MNMDVLLAALVEQKGSDLFITVDAPPTLVSIHQDGVDGISSAGMG